MHGIISNVASLLVEILVFVVAQVGLLRIFGVNLVEFVSTVTRLLLMSQQFVSCFGT